MQSKKALFLSALLITPLVIGGSAFVAQSRTQAPLPPDRNWQELEQSINYQIRHFPGQTAVYIRDLNTGWTIEHNTDVLFPSASLVKLPIMAVLYQAQVSGRLSLDESLPLLRKLKASGSGHLRFRRTGSRIRVRELIYKMITESDNTATNMLTDRLDLDYINRHFLALGLNRTNFSRMIMDLRRRDQGIENYTTAQDMGNLLEMIYFKNLTGSEEMLETLKNSKINDRLAMGIPSNWQIGHKTGLMNNACHDVGIVFSPTHDYVICVLTTKARRFRRAKGFISEVSHLAAMYYSNPSLQAAARPKPSFWTQLFQISGDTRG
ncbi:MAG: hypothetical protein A3A86_01980 [Elusimicrobia bacterium RIFCSPLOWO2_01_FULL_60_11]|nr:MAG: hypothetical protein A3A86_01980 [Elusimicrobia bacterium RIFCSPLOWO2_01_FULL_60_11]